MAVVRNLMVRIGADYSSMSKSMQGATRQLNSFSRDTQRTVSKINGRNGFGGITSEFKTLGTTVSQSLTRIKGAKGIGGVTAELSSLKPVMSTAIRGFSGLGAAAAGASFSLGPVSLAIGAVTAALVLLTAGLYSASQEAVRFEADLGRLNMQLGGSSKSFIDWARAQGLAKQSAVEMGATYSTLLSSFIRDNNELANQTQNIVKTTRVVASATGRTITDVTERMRSGILGNTESIEDLGIFVNVSMIESTEAFRRFAGDKSWEQLDFQMQQQIRLAAILEQAYKRYGDTMQDKTMTKQELLLEQLKDIKLNLSQAFLPIWDAVIPALTRMAESLAYTTEQLARFTYWLRGWDYDERTSGLDQTTEAVEQQSDAYDDLASSVSSARKELASFDRLNLIGSSSGGGTSSGTGTSSGMPSTTNGGSGSKRSSSDWNLPPLPELPRMRLEFDPPNPPDAGAGAVATAVVSTINQMAAQVNARFAQMWSSMQMQTQNGVATQTSLWGSLANNIGQVIVPALSTAIVAQTANMLQQMQTYVQNGLSTQQLSWSGFLESIKRMAVNGKENIVSTWQTMFDTMSQTTKSAVPQINTLFENLKTQILSVQNPVTSLKNLWSTSLQDMLSVFTAIQAGMSVLFSLLNSSVSSVIPNMESLRNIWNSTLTSMQTVTNTILGGIIEKVNSAINAWNRFKQALGAIPQAITDAVTPNTQSDLPGRNLPVFGYALRGLDAMGEYVESSGIGSTLRSVLVPGASGAGVGNAVKGAASTMNSAFKSVAEMLKGFGIAVPAFASGGIVSGPTLAMVGEYAGASSNPEVIAPLSDLENMLDNNEQTAILRQILSAIQNNQNVTVTISESEIANAAIRGHNKIARMQNKTPLKI